MCLKDEAIRSKLVTEYLNVTVAAAGQYFLDVPSDLHHAAFYPTVGMILYRGINGAVGGGIVPLQQFIQPSGAAVYKLDTEDIGDMRTGMFLYFQAAGSCDIIYYRYNREHWAEILKM